MEKNIRVLVVDDSAFMRRALTRLINEGRGLEVVGMASNGKEALRLVEEMKPDVITLDIEMPEMGGLELAERLMEIDSNIRVIFVTAYSQYALDAFIPCHRLSAKTS
jgi:two-component system chemotaxis response regulator CheB